MHFPTFITLATLSSLALAKDVVIKVGGSNPTKVFTPASVSANKGDVVVFQFASGNYSAIESLFPAPCIPSSQQDSSATGFKSGSGSELRVPITSGKTLWFYDARTCARGGVGAINAKESGDETLDGFRRNAIRLYGNGSSNSSSTTGSGSSSGSNSATASGGASSTATGGGGGSSTVTTISGSVITIPVPTSLSTIVATSGSFTLTGTVTLSASDSLTTSPGGSSAGTGTSSGSGASPTTSAAGAGNGAPQVMALGAKIAIPFVVLAVLL